MGTDVMATLATGASADRDFYDAEPVGTEADHRRFMDEIRTYFDAYRDRLDADLAGGAGQVAELGAGSCGLSSLLSRLPNVRNVYASDISGVRMAKMLDLSVRIVEGDRSRITVAPGDFNQRLPFDDGQLDAVLFDAALHHTRTMWGLIGECARVLRPGGVLVAQRESYLSAGRSTRQLANLLRSPEVSASVSENMYLLSQYRYYLMVGGFSVDFIPTSTSALKRALKPLNGRIFADGVLYCRKTRGA